MWNRVGRIAFWVSLPALYAYLRSGVRTRVLVVSEGKVLAVKSWLGNGRWSLPGGGLHRREDPQSGAVREVYEETGILLLPSQLKAAGLAEYRRHGLRFSYHCFIAELPASSPPEIRGGEIVDAAWIEPEELTEKTAGQDVLHLLQTWRDLR